MGYDPALLAATLADCRCQREEAITTLTDEQTLEKRELERLTADLKRFAGQYDSTRLAETHERMAQVEERVQELRQKIEKLTQELVSEDEVKEACSTFIPLWKGLTIKEKTRIIELLIEKVVFDGTRGTIAITFRPCGIKTLAAEMRNKACSN